MQYIFNTLDIDVISRIDTHVIYAVLAIVKKEINLAGSNLS